MERLGSKTELEANFKEIGRGMWVSGRRGCIGGGGRIMWEEGEREEYVRRIWEGGVGRKK